MRFFQDGGGGPSRPKAQAAPPKNPIWWGTIQALGPGSPPSRCARFFMRSSTTLHSSYILLSHKFFLHESFLPFTKNSSLFWKQTRKSKCSLKSNMSARGPVGPKAWATPFLHEICGGAWSRGPFRPAIPSWGMSVSLNAVLPGAVWGFGNVSFWNESQAWWRFRGCFFFQILETFPNFVVDRGRSYWNAPTFSSTRSRPMSCRLRRGWTWAFLVHKKQLDSLRERERDSSVVL